jgi:small subunit ribosomal protein S17
MPHKLTTLITHQIEEIVYPLGDVTDPITGKKCVMNKYREDIEKETRMFGKRETAFDYDSAPPRGRLEGKLDFSDKRAYVKYHDDGKEQPYSF